jgi:hypothetical protein
MIRIERARPGDFERVLPLLERFENPRITREHWRSLFQYPWPCPDDTRGRVVWDGGRAVGFIGVILYSRLIAGRIEEFANLTSWITLPEYRNYSLSLFKEAVSIEGRTLLCLTPRQETLPLYFRFGFQELKRKLLVLYPLPGVLWRCRATMDPVRIAERLEGNDREVFEHHNLPQCRHLLIHDRREYCHVVFTRTKGRRFHFARVHHISNPRFFLENLDGVRWRLMAGARAPLIMIDSHLLPPGKIKASRTVEPGIPTVFKSATLGPEQIDNLYTEAILLDL